METKELKIQIPEGYCIDESKSTFEKIVFKKKDTKPRSWEEYCTNTKRNGKYFIGPTSGIVKSYYCESESFDTALDKNLLPSKELAEAFLAMMQLMSLRQAWIGEWEPDWKNRRQGKYCITLFENDEVMIDENIGSTRSLSFPTKEMATDFMNTFKDLLETAKSLI